MLVDYLYLLAVDGAYFSARGHNGRSLTLLKASADSAQRLEMLEPAHFLLGKIGEYYLNVVGDEEQALGYYQRAQLLATRAGNEARAAIFLGLIAVLRFQQGEADASDLLAQAQSLAEKSGDPISLSQVLNQQSYLAAAREDWLEANRYAHDAYGVLRGLEGVVNEKTAEVQQKLFFALLNLGETEFKLGRFEAGLRFRQKALALAKAAKNPIWQGMAYFELGEMYHHQGEARLAKTNLLQALVFFQENHAQKDRERTRRILMEAQYCTQEEIDRCCIEGTLEEHLAF
jgi:tetratricopeptide (TPR) repeat protein